MDVDNKKFGGKYVATDGFNGGVIASHKNPDKLYEKVVIMGIKNPVIFFVHKKDVVCLY